MNSLVTGVTVCCNTKELLRRSYESIRKFHRDMKIIIVDGSDENDSCYEYVRSLSGPNTLVVQVGYNIGHGRGMCVGIHYTETPFALIFDSDIEMVESPIQGMLDLMEEDTYGVGYFEHTGFDGYDYGVNPHHHKEPGMKYLHPYFHLLQIKNYRKFYPYVHHGAPSFLAMLDIHKRGLSEKILKEFPGLGHTAGQGFSWKSVPVTWVRHDIAGTRTSRAAKNLPEIEGTWERNEGQV